MPDATTVLTAVGAGVDVIEGTVPVVGAFAPLIALVLTAIKAHYAATQSWPTEAQVLAALPADYAGLQATWAAWTAAHPTTTT